MVVRGRGGDLRGQRTCPIMVLPVMPAHVAGIHVLRRASPRAVINGPGEPVESGTSRLAPSLASRRER